MGDLALLMLNEALEAFVSRDVRLARNVLRQDDWLDGLKNQIFRELLTYMLGDPRTIEAGTELILMSRHLERVGDHATNIADFALLTSNFNLSLPADVPRGSSVPEPGVILSIAGLACLSRRRR